MKRGIITGALFIMLAGLLTAGTAEGRLSDWFRIKTTVKPTKIQAARLAPTPDLTGIGAPEIPYTPYNFGPTLKHGDSPIWEEAISTFSNSFFSLSDNPNVEELLLVGYYDLNHPDRIIINILLYNTASNDPAIIGDVAFDAIIEFIKVDDGTFTRSLKSYVCSKIPTSNMVFIKPNNAFGTALNWEDGQERCRKINEDPDLTDTSKYTAYLAQTAYKESQNSPNPQFDISKFMLIIDFKVSFQFTQSGLHLVDLIMPYISPANLISDPNIFSPAMYYVLFGKIKGTPSYNFIPDPVADIFIRPILKDGSNNPYNADYCYTNACTADYWHWTSIKTIPK